MSELLLNGPEKKHKWASCLEETHMTSCADATGF